MQQYEVTISKVIDVHAESEEEAIELAFDILDRDLRTKSPSEGPEAVWDIFVNVPMIGVSADGLRGIRDKASQIMELGLSDESLNEPETWNMIKEWLQSMMDECDSVLPECQEVDQP